MVAGRHTHRLCRVARRRLRSLRRVDQRRRSRSLSPRCLATSGGPRGRRTAGIVFAHRDDEPRGRATDPGLQWDLFVVAPVAGSEAWQAPLPLTDTADSETHPRVSPDGRRVVYVSDRDSTDDVDLWAMPVPAASVAKPVPLGARPARGTNALRCGVVRHQAAATPSPQQNQLAAESRPPRPVRVTRARGDESSPSWAPDNERIAFYAVRDGVGSVWVATVEPPPREGDEPAVPRPKPSAPPAARLAVGRRTGMVAGRPHAARRRPARTAARLQRQSAAQRSGAATAVRDRPARFSCGACRRRCRFTTDGGMSTDRPRARRRRCTRRRSTRTWQTLRDSVLLRRLVRGARGCACATRISRAPRLPGTRRISKTRSTRWSRSSRSSSPTSSPRWRRSSSRAIRSRPKPGAWRSTRAATSSTR